MPGQWKKIAKVLVLLGGMMLALTACQDSVPKEGQIKEDIPEDMRVIYVDSGFGEETITLDVTEVNILKRQTNEKDDTVYCTVVMSNDNYEYTADWVLNYVYYDQGGWILEGYTYNEQSDNSPILIPLTGISQEIADAEMDCYYFDSFTLKEHVFEDESDGYYEYYHSYFDYEVEYSNTYCSYNGNVILDYYFQNDKNYGYWGYGDPQYSDEFQWNVEGVWETTETNEVSSLEEDTVKVNIDSIDMDNGFIDVFVSNTYLDTMTWFEGEDGNYVEHATDGIVVADCYVDPGYDPMYNSADDFEDYFDHESRYEPPCIKFRVVVPEWTAYYISLRADRAVCQNPIGKSIEQYILQKS